MENEMQKSSKRIAVYARVSTSQQDIDKQIEMGLETAANLGYNQNEVLVLQVDGVSSQQIKLEDRLRMNELLRLMKNKAIDKKVKALFHEQQNSSGFEKKAIEKKMQSLETSINNWIEALGKGIKGLEDKIVDAQNRHEALQAELHKIDSLNQTMNISEDLIRSIVTNKKHLLQSADEADQKEVLQEFVDQIVIQPSNHLDDFQAPKLVLSHKKYGGEGNRTNVPIMSRFVRSQLLI